MGGAGNEGAALKGLENVFSIVDTHSVSEAGGFWSSGKGAEGFERECIFAFVEISVIVKGKNSFCRDIFLVREGE